MEEKTVLRKAKKKRWGRGRDQFETNHHTSRPLRGYYFIKVRKKKLTTERIHDQRL